LFGSNNINCGAIDVGALAGQETCLIMIGQQTCLTLVCSLIWTRRTNAARPGREVVVLLLGGCHDQEASNVAPAKLGHGQVYVGLRLISRRPSGGDRSPALSQMLTSVMIGASDGRVMDVSKSN
jgi:hypothetical protein